VWGLSVLVGHNGALYAPHVEVRSSYAPHMEVRSLADAFRLVMERTGWSGARLARELGVPQPWVSMVLGERRDPGMRRSAEMLEQAGWALRLTPIGEDDDPVKRREFLASAAAVTLLPSSRATPYSSAAYLDALTGHLTHHEEQIGGAPLARVALRHAHRLAAAARSGDVPPNAAASRLCRQAALILHDVRQLGRAEQVAAMAQRFAQDAQDPSAQAHAFDTLSMITAHLPDGRGAEYARRGLAVPGTDDSDRAMLSARLARSLALMASHGREARAVLDQALQLSAQPSADVAGNVGIAFTDLGMARHAEPHLTAAAELSAASPFLRSLYLAREVKTAIRARQPDVAAGHMLSLAVVAPMVDSPRLHIHLKHIMDGTQRWATIPAVRDARETLREAAT
jgi:hypothetical protein